MLHPDKFYHVFNHANGDDNLFRTPENYRYFLSKFDLYICPIAEVYAYCLMPNHFHFLVKIKPVESFLEFEKFKSIGKIDNQDDYYQLRAFVSKQFSNLFSCYTQSFNKLYRRRGSLFIKNFKTQEVHDHSYFRNVVRYIHRNPVHHGFVRNFEDWPWSSYLMIISNADTIINKEALITMFDGVKPYLDFHQERTKSAKISLIES